MGSITVVHVAAVAISLLVFVLLANLVVDLYARGVARAAVDEAVRRAAVADGDLVTCDRRAREVVRGLVGGELARRIVVECSSDGGVVRARARADLPSWLPVIPSWTFEVTARATEERELPVVDADDSVALRSVGSR